MLRRSAAAAVGLTVFSSAGTALGMSRGAFAPPQKGSAAGMAALVKAAKKEGKLNTIALPPDWANYGEMMSTFQKKYGIKITNDNPDGSSAQENEAVRSLKGDSRAPDVLDVGVAFGIAGANEGLYAKYFPSNYKTIPRALKDTRGFWMGDYWGAISIGYNKSLVSNPPKTWADLLKPEYKGKVAMNGSPLTSGSAIAGVIAAAIGAGGSVQNVQAGIDYFASLKKSGNFIPVQTTPATVASGQTPISIDWDYNNLAYIKGLPAANWGVSIPSDGVYGGYYAQAVNATAPHPYAARLWEEFVYSDQGQIIYLKGFAHPARFNDLAQRKVLPKALLSALPAASIYAKVKFASPDQQTKAKNLIAAQWPTKVG
jgi:putative spermidine/putrescine transport system substrate-binding protein